MVTVQPIVLSAMALALCLAMVTDLRSHKIPNWLSYPVVFLSILSYSAANGLNGLLFSAEGLGLGLAVLMPFYIFGGMGAGDVKLMGAVGAALGPGHLLGAFVCTAFAGGVYSSILLLSRGGSKGLVSRIFAALHTMEPALLFPRLDQASPKTTMCYGVAIAVGTLAYTFFAVFTGHIYFTLS